MSAHEHNGSSPKCPVTSISQWCFRQHQLHACSDIRTKLKSLTADMVLRGYHYLDIFSVRWSIGEALLNAIQHGHRGDKSKTVRLSYVIADEYVLAEIMDEGVGFDPNEVPDPFASNQNGQRSKKGLFMMRLFMSWIRFEGCGNRVVLCKSRTPQSPFQERPTLSNH